MEIEEQVDLVEEIEEEEETLVNKYCEDDLFYGKIDHMSKILCEFCLKVRKEL